MHTVLADARRGHRGLFWFAAAMVALTAVLLVAAVVDQRTLLGAPLWFKPLKFSVSLAAYAATLAWMLGQLREPALRRTGWAIAVAGAVEIVIIVGQAARGVRSHFNDDTLADSLLFAVMGATIAVLYLATAAIALRFLREPGRDRAAGLAIRLGLLVGLVGMGVGVVMSVIGSHAVGVADGGPGLPFVGWSTTGGDLRIGHFVGMHALQALPLLAAALAATGRFTEATRSRAVTVAAVAYGAVVLLVTWQALRGQPLLAPDALTLGTLAAIVVGTAGALLAGRDRVPV
ncbi:hypothetical protein [Pseudonocardia hydrocarbonoxydans]|uniref:Uncharacterized protein n=1 Tax=Pseudonocardia hydrocarbonoxydans TaxID=76726 RepID=A0A4Y3WLK1_9PSEU|nr:hypothetical protein [Pseudonocardia hydrocarbonoxydans]GEC19655.1 hypothetical protein PHY01_19380 [Pseudonocardia hydrocarbonoxydans]